LPQAKKLGLAVNEVLFVLNAARDLKRRPDVAFISYARWPSAVVERAAAWNVVPDLAVEMVSPTNLAQEITFVATDRQRHSLNYTASVWRGLLDS
jgi:Uma2 family endonuclease